jgi:hypothetical protein
MTTTTSTTRDQSKPRRTNRIIGFPPTTGTVAHLFNRYYQSLLLKYLAPAVTMSKTTTTKVTPKEQRASMIDSEMKVLIDAARDFCFEHLDDDMDEEAVKALTTAAYILAYRNQYYDVLKDKMVYYPSCRRLVLTKDILDEAEKHYYDEDDEFPPEYSKAVRTVVFDEIQKSNENDNNMKDDQLDNEMYEMIEKLGAEWSEAL